MNKIRRKRLRDLNTDEKREFIQQSLKILNKFVSEFSKDLSKSFKSLEDAVEKHSKVVAPLLRKSRMWYFPSMPDAIYDSLSNLIAQESKISIEQVEQIFINHYQENNYKNLKEMVASWFDIPIFIQRKNIIEDALDAHILGKFSLSIPALLPQVEGILSSLTGQTAGHPGALLKDAIKASYPNDNSSFNALDNDILIALATDPFLFKGGAGDFFTPEKFDEWVALQGIERSPLNRHGILHGVQIDYATKENSIRVFFLLDSVHGLASEKIKTTIGKS